ncbi:SAVED domain-containing protein [Pseudothermotoga sp. U03pept]|uniref:SAVED domain-containing protein n=1 Tax=Pseudothermotoga sp. U03pept TaxID=3447012 RepID=UPI003F0A8CE9
MKFSGLLKQNQEFFVCALREDALTLDEAIETLADVCKDRGEEYSVIIYEILLRARRSNYKNHEKLAELFDKDAELAFDLLNESYTSFDFPVISKNGARIARGLVFNTRRTFTNICAAEQHIEKLSYMLGKTFSVVFDTDIVDESFILSLYVALVAERVNPKMIFTGSLYEDFTIKSVENYEEKERLARKLGKVLISSHEVSDARELKRYLTSKKHDVAFLVSYSNKTSRNYLEESYHRLKEKIESVVNERLFQKLSKVSLVYSSPTLRDCDFQREVVKLSKMLSRIISTGATPHLSIIGPSSLAMGIGAAFGAQNSIVLYHYQSNEYHRVIDLRANARSIKKLMKMSDLEKTDVEETGDGRDCAFVIHFASHSPFSDVGIYLKKRKIDAKIVKIFHKELGGIKVSDWSQEVAELMTIIQSVRDKAHFERLHFFLSLPVPIAFALGMALGPFVNASIYQYTTGKKLPYFEAVRLEDLRT